MGHHIFELLRGFLLHYGYWAVAIALLLENTGLPVPGETILLLGSFLAFSQRQLQLPWIIVVGIASATLGDNIGFFVGLRGGRPLLNRYRQWFRISKEAIANGERVFQRYGPATIFFARFVAGLRVIAGPLAGILRMEWRRFAIYNFLGATVWVTVIATVGYVFGRHWGRLLHIVKEFNITILVIGVIVVVLMLWRHRADKDSDPADDASG
jgi:membrane protein DedA with SNARE-associated domain